MGKQDRARHLQGRRIFRLRQQGQTIAPVFAEPSLTTDELKGRDVEMAENKGQPVIFRDGEFFG